MSTFFREGEVKKRPGMYKRYSNDGTGAIAGAITGVLAFPFANDWGPVNEIVEISSGDYLSTIKSAYGTGGHTEFLKKMMAAGLTTIYACRVGSGGTRGALALKNGSDNIATLTLKYPGNADFSATLRTSVSDSTVYQLVTYIDSVQVEVLSFSTYAELCALDSDYYIVTGALETAPETLTLTLFVSSSFTGGTNPTTTVTEYETALSVLESKRYNVVVADTVDSTVRALLPEYINMAFENGKNAMCVIGDPTQTLAVSCARAAAVNSMLTAYYGSEFKDAEGNTITGAEAVAIAAAVIAATPANQSITHVNMPTAAALNAYLTNSQYVQAIEAGLLVLSASPDGVVWFDSGVNTLVSPSADQDDGWKKIRRTKTRLELFDRIDRTIEPLIGRVNNNDEGINNVLEVAQAVINAMISENKLISGSIAIDENAGGFAADYAYFIIAVQDLDSLEKIYLNYRFRYTA